MHQQLDSTENAARNSERKNTDCNSLDNPKTKANKPKTSAESDHAENEAVTLYSWKANGNQLVLHTTKTQRSNSSNPGSSADEPNESPRERRMQVADDIVEIKTPRTESPNLNKTRPSTPMPFEIELPTNSEKVNPMKVNAEDMKAISPAFIKNEDCVSVESQRMTRRIRVRDDIDDLIDAQQTPIVSYSDSYKIEQKSLGAVGEVISFEPGQKRKQVVRKLSNLINDLYKDITNTNVYSKLTPTESAGEPEQATNKFQTNLDARNVSISMQPKAVVVEDENYEAPSKRILTCHSRKGMVYVKRKSDPETVPRKSYMVKLVTVYEGKTVKTLTVFDGDVGIDDTLTFILPIKPGDPADDSLMDEVTVEETHGNHTTLKSTKYVHERKSPVVPKQRISPSLRASNSSIKQSNSADHLTVSTSNSQLRKSPTPSTLKPNSKTLLQKVSSQSLGGTPAKKVPMNRVQTGIAPPPNIKSVRSRIQSLPVKPKSAIVDSRTAVDDPTKLDKKIVSMKLKWNAGSKIDSFSNSNYKSSGGNKKVIENKRINYTAVTPRIESRNTYSKQAENNSTSSSGQSSVASRPSTSSIRWKF